MAIEPIGDRPGPITGYVSANRHVANFLERRDDQANAKPCSLCAAFWSKVRVVEHPLQIPKAPISESSIFPAPLTVGTIPATVIYSVLRGPIKTLAWV